MKNKNYVEPEEEVTTLISSPINKTLFSNEHILTSYNKWSYSSAVGSCNVDLLTSVGVLLQCISLILAHLYTQVIL